MTTTDETTETDGWQFPLATIWEQHRARIAGHEDFVPAVVEAWMEGMDMPIWTVWINNGDENHLPRDTGLHALKVMASVTNADYLLFSFDTHMTSLPENPKTGKPWGPGEMQAMCDEEGFCETGQMRDNLVISIVRRSDKALIFHSIPYHFHGDGELMFWDDVEINEWEATPESGSEPGPVMSGLIVNRMRAAMDEPSITALMQSMGVTPDQFGMDARETQLHSTLAGARLLADIGKSMNVPNVYISMIPAFSEEERKIIEASAALADMDVADPETWTSV